MQVRSWMLSYILMYSALHIMQWFSHSLDVFTPKIKRKFFDFYILWIKTNVAYTRLEMIARTKYCTTTTASNWFVTLYYKLLPAVRSPSKHGRWRSSLLLYSISMGETYLNISAPSLSVYSCSPRWVSRKLWTVYETVSCMQQLRERYASRTCYYARASLVMTPAPGIELCAIAAYRLFHSHAQV